jgi:peptidoglycan/LPS O-acetylase OafA/YrhL
MTQKLHLWFGLMFIALGYILFGTTTLPAYIVNIRDNNSLHNFFATAHQPQREGVFRWAMPDAQIIVPQRIVGLVMIDYAATTARQPTTLVLTSNLHPIATHVVQPDQFRMYHILGNIPWQFDNSTTQITLNSNYFIHDSERTQTVALSQFRVHAYTRATLPNITLWPIIAIVLLTIVSSYAWKQTPRTIIALYACHSISLILIWWRVGLPHWLLPWYVLGVAAYAVIPWISDRLQLATPFTETPPPHGYRGDIDGLRAIAVIAVVLYHFFPAQLPGGYVGVDVFFVISGYLITQIILDKLVTQQWSITDFYVRRIRRILPAVTVMVLMTIGVGGVFFVGTERQELGRHVVAGVGFFANILLYTDVNYFNADIAYKPLLHLWSLGVEEQFYIGWPIALAVAYRQRRNIGYLMMGVVLLSFISNIMLVDRDPDAAFYLPFTRIWELAIGGLLALRALMPQTPFTSNQKHTLSVLGVIAIIASCWLFDGTLLFPGYWALVPVLGATALIAAGPAGFINTQLLARRLLVRIGLISFPLYLWHWPVLRFGSLFVETLTGPQALFLIALSVGLAILSYLCVEKPLRHGRWSHVPPLAILATTVVVGGIGVSMAYGWWNSHNSNLADSVAIQQAKAQIVPCTTLLSQPFTGDCVQHTSPQSTGSDYIIIGDSHAYQLTLGLVDNQEPHTVTSFSRPGCYPAVGIDFYVDYRGNNQTPWGCDVQGFAGVFRMLETQASARHRTIFVLGRYSVIQTHSHNASDTRHWYLQRTGPRQALSDSQRATILAAALSETLQRLSALPNTTVVFVHQVPELDFSPKQCYYNPLRALPHSTLTCTTTQAKVTQFFALYKAALTPVLARLPAVKVYDPLPLFCDGTTCAALDKNHYWYNDATHISIAGAQRIAADLYTRFP